MSTNDPKGVDRLIARLIVGERWGGDNAEALEALGFERVEKLTRPTKVRDAFDYWIKGNLHVSDCRPLDSVDDALRLVPEGWLAEAYQWRSDVRPWTWTLVDDRSDCHKTVEGRASTPAIALTIAILEASRG